MSDLRNLTVVRRELVAKPRVNPQSDERILPFAPLAIAPEIQRYVRLKTSIEWCVALVLLVLMSPLLLGLAILVGLTSKGSVIYSQWRVGRSGKPFRIYKLRTMVHQCEAHTGPVWAVTDDPRSTRVGHWLRDTHLDELPQLWNVLRGHMSLIGPRPERPEIAAQIEQTIPQFQYRLLVRPGITGLAANVPAGRLESGHGPPKAGVRSVLHPALESLARRPDHRVDAAPIPGRCGPVDVAPDLSTGIGASSDNRQRASCAGCRSAGADA